MKKEPNYKLIMIISSIIIVVLGLGTYFFIGWKSYQLREAQLKIDQQKLQDTQDEAKKEETKNNMNKTSLNWCLSFADDNYNSFWNSECASQGLGDDCKLPTYNVNRVDDKRTQDKAECYKKYPTK